MPLNPTTLSAAIVAFITDIYDGDESFPADSVQAFADGLAAAVVTEIQTNAVVSTIVTGSSPSGPVTGTGTGTIL